MNAVRCRGFRRRGPGHWPPFGSEEHSPITALVPLARCRSRSFAGRRSRLETEGKVAQGHGLPAVTAAGETLCDGAIAGYSHLKGLPDSGL